MTLLNDDALERSAVVANCRMNRERSLTGSNGYARELGIDPLESLLEKATTHNRICWLDLCCGTGKALIEAADTIQREGLSDWVRIVGVDLVGGWSLPDLERPCLEFVEASLATWEPDERFDLITCVHGLHYIGDKLGLISRAVSWLKDSGVFVANLDLTNLHVQNGSSSDRIVATSFRRNGLEFNSRKRLVTCVGQKRLNLPFFYLGADDQVGPNYTGQPVVNSHYLRIENDGRAG